MRRIFGVILLALCILTGCANNSSVPTGDTEHTIYDPTPTLGMDADNRYLLVTAASFQETDSFYFGTSLTGNHIHYYDKASGISGVVCADPACTHTSADCSAYIDSSSSLSCYDGKLWWIARDSSNDFYLWCSDLSGTNREQIKCLSFEDVIMVYQPQQYIIHRDTLYLLGKSSTVTGTKVSSRLSLLATPLDSSEELTILYDQTFDAGVQMSVRFAGEKVYSSIISFPDGGPYDITITNYNITDGSTETVYEETGMTDIPGNIWVTEQGEIYLPGIGESGTCLWKLENGTRTEIVAWAGENPTVPKVMDGIAVNTYKDSGVRYIQVNSLTGESIYEGKLFPDGVPGLDGNPNEYSMAVIGGDAEKMILNLSSPANPELNYTVALDINDNMNATVLWSSAG